MSKPELYNNLIIFFSQQFDTVEIFPENLDGELVTMVCQKGKTIYSMCLTLSIMMEFTNESTLYEYLSKKLGELFRDKDVHEYMKLISKGWLPN